MDTCATLLMFYILMVAFFFITAQGEILLAGKKGVLPCVANALSNDEYQWSDVTDSTAIYRVDGNGVRALPGASNTKYENFSVDNGFPTSVNISIDPVLLEHVGEYQCQLLIAPVLETVNVEVEVIADSVAIDRNENDGIVNATESYTFTCTAIGVRSPNALNLTWSTSNIEEMAVTTRTENVDPNLQNLRSTFTFMPNKNDMFLKCGITEYVNQEQIEEDLITDTLELNVQYVPTCTLEIEGSEVSASICIVMLTCKCDANPEVNTNGYSYFKDSSPIDGDINKATGDVNLDTTAMFSCSAGNIVGPGEPSPGVSYTCSTPTTASMKTEKTPGPTPTGGPKLAAIIIPSILGVSVALCGLAALIYFCCFREPSNSSKGNNSVRDGESDIAPASNEETNSSAPLYGVVNKDKKKKSDGNTDGKGVNSTNSDQPEYAAVNKPLKNEPTAAPRSSAPSAGEEPEKMELQYADIDHGNKGPTFEIRQPADAPTEYATVQSVIV